MGTSLRGGSLFLSKLSSFSLKKIKIKKIFFFSFSKVGHFIFNDIFFFFFLSKKKKIFFFCFLRGGLYFHQNFLLIPVNKEERKKVFYSFSEGGSLFSIIYPSSACQKK